ncbi:MAG: hypothetical protein MR239_04770 [Clostridiales bacterium]|nr:hypothetical protein [Clostridiales bacterium]MDY4654678.1 hypothetical protein [Eubacteriales bacterium]
MKNTVKSSMDVNERKDRISSEVKVKRRLSESSVWTIKITLITLCLAFFVSFATYLTSNKSNFIISVLTLALLIVVAIAFDSVGVAVTSCNLAPLLALSAKKVKGAAIAVKLVKNAEKVSNICNDVVGDMAGIISGTCAATVAIQLFSGDGNLNLFNILISSVVSAVTVGGKAFFKSVAINNSKEMVLFVGRIIGIFYRPRMKKHEN